MILTNENYYSMEANRQFLSVSQYKDFCGTLGKQACEEQALAKLNGLWETCLLYTSDAADEVQLV